MPELELFVGTRTQDELLGVRQELHLLDVVRVCALAREDAACAFLDVEELPARLVGATEECAFAGCEVEEVDLVLVFVFVSTQRHLLPDLVEVDSTKAVACQYDLSILSQFDCSHHLSELAD